MTNEPVWTVATVTAAVSAVIALATSFGLPLTDAQTTGIMGVVAVLAPLAVALWARGRVTPNGKISAPTQE